VAVLGHGPVGEVGERREGTRLVEEVEADGTEDGAEDESRAPGQADPLFGARRGGCGGVTLGGIGACACGIRGSHGVDVPPLVTRETKPATGPATAFYTR